MAYSQKIKESIEAFFKEKDWKYSFNEEHECFETGISLNNKLKRCDVSIYLHEEYYTVYSVLPIKADEKCLREVGEFLHRANYGMKWGTFELDYNDGEIRIRSFVDCGDDCDCPPSSSVVRDSIEIPPYMFDTYGDGLLAVMFGFMTPEEAISKSESEAVENEA